MAKKTELRKRVERNFKQITLLFGGVGGGIPFIKLQWMVTNLTTQAEAGDEGAQVIVNSVIRFAALCRVAAKRTGTKL